MRHLLAIVLLAAGLRPAAGQITVSLRDGSSLSATAVTPQGARLQVAVEGGAPRIVEAAAIERIDMPAPASLTEAYAAFAGGDTVKTLQAIGKARSELDAYKSIAGARDWWLDGEFLRAAILLSQRRNKDVETAMTEIAKDATDPEAQRRANAYLAHLVGLGGDPRKALDDLKLIILAARDPETLADAWLFTGLQRAAVNQPQEAILAFLRVPAFYPTRSVALAGARLGSARCFVALEGLDNLAVARRLLKELVATQATTLEGIEGKKLLTQVERELGLHTDGAAPAPASAPAPTPEESKGNK